MTGNKISSQSLEQLQQSKKMVKAITIILAVVLVLLLAVGLYITFTQKFTALLVIPLALSPILFLNLKNLKTIQVEIDSRK